MSGMEWVGWFAMMQGSEDLCVMGKTVGQAVLLYAITHSP